MSGICHCGTGIGETIVLGFSLGINLGVNEGATMAATRAIGGFGGASVASSLVILVMTSLEPTL